MSHNFERPTFVETGDSDDDRFERTESSLESPSPSTDERSSSPENDSPRRSDSPLTSAAVLGARPLRVLISGAGLSGLACALNLRRYGIEATIIERDEGLHTREQGYNLTCKMVGQVWERCGLLDIMKNYDCSSSLYFSYKNDGSVLQHFEVPAVMLCPRDLLRSTMLKQIDTNNIQTGCTITSFHQNKDNTVRVCLSDNTVRDYDLIVAADGIRSSIRTTLLPSTPLNYTGVVIILGTARCFHERARHRFQMLDGKIRMFCKPYGDTGAFWQCTYKVDTMQECYDLAKLGGEAILAMLKQMVGSWASPTPEFLETTPASTIYVSPLIDRDTWEVSDLKIRNVALIGDAAHPMTPFRGEGANNAMEDGVLLADMIGRTLSSNEDTAGVIDEFHTAMMARATKHVYESREAVNTSHDPRCVDKDWIDQRWDYSNKTSKRI